MRRFVTTLLLTVGLLPGVSLATSYKVTKVIEVGPAAQVSYASPLEWSPDGTMLAYLANNYLMVSDTLGNSREVYKIDIGIRPRRFEWASNDKIAINLPRYRLPDSALYNTITVVDVNSGQDMIVIADTPRTNWKPVYQRAGDTFFEGPFLSLEGNAYYVIKTYTGRQVKLPRGTVAETTDEYHWFFPDKAPAMADNHIVRWGTDGLYLIALDQSDSTWLAKDPYGQAFEAVVSRDYSHVFTLSTLINVSDSTTIDLRKLAGERPAGTFGCGYLFVSFNPKTSEMLFNQTCDGNYPSGTEFVVDRIGTFNYTTNEFIILDTITGIQNCTTPVYAPDGKKIAFLADYKAYIIYREEE